MFIGVCCLLLAYCYLLLWVVVFGLLNCSWLFCFFDCLLVLVGVLLCLLFTLCWALYFVRGVVLELFLGLFDFGFGWLLIVAIVVFCLWV